MKSNQRDVGLKSVGPFFLAMKEQQKVIRGKGGGGFPSPEISESTTNAASTGQVISPSVEKLELSDPELHPQTHSDKIQCFFLLPCFVELLSQQYISRK